MGCRCAPRSSIMSTLPFSSASMSGNTKPRMHCVPEDSSSIGIVLPSSSVFGDAKGCLRNTSSVVMPSTGLSCPLLQTISPMPRSRISNIPRAAVFLRESPSMDLQDPWARSLRSEGSTTNSVSMALRTLVHNGSELREAIARYVLPEGVMATVLFLAPTYSSPVLTKTRLGRFLG